MKFKIRKIIRTPLFKKIAIVVGAIIAFIVIGLAYAYMHNFYPVIPGEVYRSRQLSKEHFAEVIQDYHIHSIINLRGAHKGIRWYDEEIAASKGIVHYDLALKSKELPPPATLKALVHLIEVAPKPLLVHCQSGVDRTGMAAAIALLLKDAPLSEVERQVSYHYFVISEKSVGKQMLVAYEQWLQLNHLQSSRVNFLKWIDSLEPQVAKSKKHK